MVTRVRVEAEGSTIQEVENALTEVFETLHCETVGRKGLTIMFGEPDERGSYPGLADMQAGEFVIERFARDCRTDDGRPDAGDGAIVYRGRMTAHFARPAKTRKLYEREATTAHQTGVVNASNGAGATVHLAL